MSDPNRSQWRGPRPAGDLLVWESLTPNGKNDPLPAPSKTLRLGGIVSRMINSHDGRWLYFLDVHNRKLCRIDSETAQIDREITSLTAGVTAFCLTPDGKRIYCSSEAGLLDVLDAVA